MSDTLVTARSSSSSTSSSSSSSSLSSSSSSSSSSSLSSSSPSSSSLASSKTMATTQPSSTTSKPPKIEMFRGMWNHNLLQLHKNVTKLVANRISDKLKEEKLPERLKILVKYAGEFESKFTKAMEKFEREILKCPQTQFYISMFYQTFRPHIGLFKDFKTIPTARLSFLRLFREPKSYKKMQFVMYFHYYLLFVDLLSVEQLNEFVGSLKWLLSQAAFSEGKTLNLQAVEDLKSSLEDLKKEHSSGTTTSSGEKIFNTEEIGTMIAATCDTMNFESILQSLTIGKFLEYFDLTCEGKLHEMTNNIFLRHWRTMTPEELESVTIMEWLQRVTEDPEAAFGGKEIDETDMGEEMKMFAELMPNIFRKAGEFGLFKDDDKKSTKDKTRTTPTPEKKLTKEKEKEKKTSQIAELVCFLRDNLDLRMFMSEGQSSPMKIPNLIKPPPTPPPPAATFKEKTVWTITTPTPPSPSPSPPVVLPGKDRTLDRQQQIQNLKELKLSEKQIQEYLRKADEQKLEREKAEEIKRKINQLEKLKKTSKEEKKKSSSRSSSFTEDEEKEEKQHIDAKVSELETAAFGSTASTSVPRSKGKLKTTVHHRVIGGKKKETSPKLSSYSSSSSSFSTTSPPRKP